MCFICSIYVCTCSGLFHMERSTYHHAHWGFMWFTQGIIGLVISSSHRQSPEGWETGLHEESMDPRICVAGWSTFSTTNRTVSPWIGFPLSVSHDWFFHPNWSNILNFVGLPSCSSSCELYFPLDFNIKSFSESLAQKYCKIKNHTFLFGWCISTSLMSLSFPISGS